MGQAALVLDVGKTHAKLTLVDRDGTTPISRTRANAPPIIDGRRVLDTTGIETWMLAAMRELASLARIVAIIPVGHGAAAALIADGALAAPVLDYEQPTPSDVAAAYARERDPFEETLSPRLPDGLNLGQQLYWQETLYSDLWPARATALLWPQYWAWRLSGEMAAEVSSLGCHTDLWRPYARDYSDLAKRRGWADRFGPLRGAGKVLGPIRPDIAAATGLPCDCAILCGAHDSNASLHAVRGSPDLTGGPFSLVSTGTWFVAFQVGGEAAPQRDPARDTLANVGVDGAPTPSARFMGGREYAAIVGDDFNGRGSIDDARALVERGVATTPAFVSGSGPFPAQTGRMIGEPANAAERAALASLHLALMTDASLDLIGAQGPIVIEGRFAEDSVYPAALAALRSDAQVLLCGGGDGVALGAARLWLPALAGPALTPVPSGRLDLADYAARWRAAAGDLVENARF